MAGDLPPIATAVLDDALRVVYVSEQMPSLTGEAPEEVFGPLWEALEPECRNVLASGKPITVHPPEPLAGSFRSPIRCRPVRRPDESIGGLELVTLAPQTQPQDALGRLAGGIAHDFNNMLTAIGGYTGLVRDTLSAGDRRRDDLDETLKAVARARLMALRLLAFVEGRQSDREAVAVDEVTLEVERLLRHVLGEPIRLQTRLGSGNTVSLHVGELEQILVNLALNARDAMPDGGTLRIATSNVSLAAPIANGITKAPAGEYVAIAVTDSGQGMDAATRERVFDTHFTTKALPQGAGLGLPSVLASVEQAGGDLVFTSDPGDGTRVELYLPRAPTSEPAEDSSAPVPQGTENVVVIVDDEQVRSATVRMLEGLGYTAVGVDTGDLAVAISGPGGPDLLIVDVALPGADVQELARLRAAAEPSLKVLYIGGASSGAVAWPLLVKPFDQRALGRRVRGVLDS